MGSRRPAGLPLGVERQPAARTFRDGGQVRIHGRFRPLRRQWWSLWTRRFLLGPGLQLGLSVLGLGRRHRLRYDFGFRINFAFLNVLQEDLLDVFGRGRNIVLVVPPLPGWFVIRLAEKEFFGCQTALLIQRFCVRFGSHEETPSLETGTYPQSLTASPGPFFNAAA